MKLIKTDDLVNIETMLSSTTYPTDYFKKCVYCHKDVENEHYNYDGEYYQPYRCSCKKAQEELRIKEKILDEFKGLEDLNKDINEKEINKALYEKELRELNLKYNMKQTY